jgi:hypothetical protein
MTRELPRTLEGALDPAWLSDALAPVSGGARVAEVEVVELIQVNATKVRFKARYESGATGAYCLKAFLDQPEKRPNSASVREANFYTELSSKISVRAPTLVAAPMEREAEFAIVIMDDLIEAGARFCTALEPFDADMTARSLEQLARLHTSHTTLGPVEQIAWAPRQIDWLAGYMTPQVLQTLMDGPRSEGMPVRQCDAALLIAALKALAALDARRPSVLVHGDCHAGNIFETGHGLGLIDWQLLQRGGWALDVAYHIAATLPEEVAAREERNLLDHYIDTARSLGGHVPDREEAWAQYRVSPVYGFFLWAITRNVAAPITNTFFQRLGRSVARHDSYALLGL